MSKASGIRACSRDSSRSVRALVFAMSDPGNVSADGQPDTPPAVTAGGERADLLAAVAKQRHFVRFTARGLTDEQDWRIDARDQLRTAYEMFPAMGADGFAGRAACQRRARLQAHHRDPRPAHPLGDPDRLAGLRNPQIAAQLFMSPRTVEYHPHKVFAKLCISSRNQLRVLAGDTAGTGREPWGAG